MRTYVVFFLAVTALLGTGAPAQTLSGRARSFVAHSNLIMPQSRVVRFAAPVPQPAPVVRINEVRADVKIVAQPVLQTQ